MIIKVFFVQLLDEIVALFNVVKEYNEKFPDESAKEVYLNRPFVYAIINRETDIPVFSGVVNQL